MPTKGTGDIMKDLPSDYQKFIHTSRYARWIEKEKRLIQFPWQMVLLTKLISIIPNRIYEKLEGFSIKRLNNKLMKINKIK